MKKVVSLILTMIMCSCFVIPSATAAEDNEQTGYDTLSYTPSDYLELATPKVFRFALTDETNSIKNICEAFLSMGRASVRCEDYSPIQLVAEQHRASPQIQYRISEYEYLNEYWNCLDVEIISDNVWFSNFEMESNGNSATAKIVEHYTYYLDSMFEGPNYRNREYTFVLEKSGNSWDISEISTNDPVESGTFTYAPLARSKAVEIATEVPTTDTSFETVLQEIISTTDTSRPYRWTYNTAVAVDYAEEYYDATQNGGYNDLFPFQTGNDIYGNNCQNFASQCVWAGLIGNMTDVENATDRTAVPAVSQTLAGENASNLWCFGQTSSQHDGRCSWYSTNGFAKMLGMSTPEKDGPYGTTYYSSVQYADVGSVVGVNRQGAGTYGNLQHAMFVTEVTGTSGSRGVSDIKIACNSSPSSSANEPLGAYCPGCTANQFSTSKIICGYYSVPQ